MNPMDFKPGDLLKYKTGTSFAGSPCYYERDSFVDYGCVIRFLRSHITANKQPVVANLGYYSPKNQLEPCSQTELDNWILEQELTS